MFTSLYYHLYGIDTRTTDVEEVIHSSHLFYFEHFREDVGKEPLHLTFWCDIFNTSLHLRRRQYLTVDLTVRSHRHALHPHICIRHHIVSQRRCGESSPQILISQRRLRLQGIV